MTRIRDEARGDAAIKMMPGEEVVDRSTYRETVWWSLQFSDLNENLVRNPLGVSLVLVAEIPRCFR